MNRFPQVAVPKDQYEDDYDGKEKQRKQGNAAHGLSPKPPSTKSFPNSSGVSPKKDKVVNSTYFGYDGDTSNSGNRHNSTNINDGAGAGWRGGNINLYDGILLEPNYGDISINANGGGDHSTPSNFRPNQPKGKKGAALPGLLPLNSNGYGNSESKQQNNGGTGPGYSNRTPAKDKRKEMEDYHKQTYLEELESHIETLHKHVAAWKIRYFVELTRLGAARSTNRNMMSRLDNQKNEVYNLEQHVLLLSKQLATAQEEAEAQIQAKKGKGKGKGDDSDDEAHTPNASGKSNKDYTDPHGPNGHNSPSHAHATLKHGANLDEAEEHHAAQVQYTKGLVEEIRQLKASMVKLNKSEHEHVKTGTAQTEKIHQLLTEKENIQRNLHNECTAHSETLSLANARQHTISELKRQLQDTEIRMDKLTNETDAEYIDSLKEALKQEIEAHKVVNSLNVDAQKKYSRLENKYEEQEDRLASMATRHQEDIKANDNRWKAQVDELNMQIRQFTSTISKSGDSKLTTKQMEIIIANQTRKMKEELAESQNASSQLVTANLDIRLLETEVKSMRVQMKLLENELKEVKDENIATSMELNTARVDARGYKDKYTEHKVQAEVAQRQQAELRSELNAYKSGEVGEAQQRIYDSKIEELNSRHKEALEGWNIRLEAVMLKHSEQCEEMAEHHAVSLRDNAERHTAALSICSQRCDDLSTELGHALQFIEQLEQSGAVARYSKTMKLAAKAAKRRERGLRTGTDDDDDDEDESESDTEDGGDEEEEEDEEGEGKGKGERERDYDGASEHSQGTSLQSTVYDVNAQSTSLSVSTPFANASSAVNSPATRKQKNTSPKEGKEGRGESTPKAKKLTKSQKLSALLVQTAENMARSNEERLASIVLGLEEKLQEMSSTSSMQASSAAAAAATAFANATAEANSILGIGNSKQNKKKPNKQRPGSAADSATSDTSKYSNHTTHTNQANSQAPSQHASITAANLSIAMSQMGGYNSNGNGIDNTLYANSVITPSAMNATATAIGIGTNEFPKDLTKNRAGYPVHLNPNVLLHSSEEYFDMILMTRQLDELWRVHECKCMALGDLESAHFAQTEELSHSVVYARFLEEELFNARKR